MGQRTERIHPSPGLPYTSPLPPPRHKLQIQSPHIYCKVITCLPQNPPPILPRRKLDIKLEQDPRGQCADLHVRQLLADAAEGARGKGRESVFVLDQVGLGGPAGGEEGGGGGVGAFVCGGKYRFFGEGGGQEEGEVLPRPITYCGIQ